MRIIHNYSVDIKPQSDAFFIHSEEIHICEGCGRPMKCKDLRKRIGRKLDGSRLFYLVRRMYCYDCHIMHTELPDFLIKFKHFEVQIIEDTIDGDITIEEGYESTSEMTMHRWQAWFAAICPIIDSILYSILAMLEGLLPNLLDTASLLGALREQGEGWLITAFSVMINAGKYP